MSSNVAEIAVEAKLTSNPLDIIPDEIPFDVPYENLMHLNYLRAFDGIIASRGGIPLFDRGKIIGAIGCTGCTDSRDEVVSDAGAAVINKLPTGIK